MRSRLHARREGIALPMAILLVGFITAGIIGAFGRMTGETRTMDSNRTTTLAFALAERGLEARVATGDTLPDSVRYTYPEGFVDVRVSKLRNGLTAMDTTVWLIRATGSVGGGRPGRPPARRSVAQMAVKATATLDANAAWTSLSGLRKNGNSGRIWGYDPNECTVENAVSGAEIPAGTFSGQTGPFDGNPPVDEHGTQRQFADGVHIDWGGIVGNPPAITPDIVIPGGNARALLQCENGNCPIFDNPHSYPIILVNGDLDFNGWNYPGWGRGLLIVKGMLTFRGGEQWKGMILVGDEMSDKGNGDVRGAVISGLNIKLGLLVSESVLDIDLALAGGTKSYYYNPCEIANALQGVGGFGLIPNAWIDNWSAW